MKWINEKRVELQRIINNIPGCYPTDNKAGFTFNAGNGVVWAKTKRGKKWGQAFEEDDRFFAVIDFPVDSYNITELSERIGLGQREQGEPQSGIRLRKDKLYDSVQIAIYQDTSNVYNFNNESFINFVNEVAFKVKVN